MADEPTGAKPDEQQAQQPEVTPTLGITGEKVDQSVSPTDADPSVIEDDQVVEKDGQKVVPLDALLAERTKRQELEQQLKAPNEQQQQAQEPQTEEPTTEESPEINWDELLGLTQPQPAPASATTPQQPTAQPTQPAPQLPASVQEFNESLREQRESGEFFFERN